jgi:hypothetical protein
MGSSVTELRSERPTWIDAHLIDDVVDAYVDWREQCQRVWLAYHLWSSAVPKDGRLRFAAYVEELDREHRASDVYATTIARAAVSRSASAVLSLGT